MKIQPIFRWCALYIGFYWSGRRDRLYVMVVPTLGFYIQFRQVYTCEIYKRECKNGEDKFDMAGLGYPKLERSPNIENDCTKKDFK